MITRKITYSGRLDAAAAEMVFDIARRIEITGEIKFTTNKLELDLEGDPSMIKLVQHQVERKLKALVENKEVVSMPMKNYRGLDFLR